MNVFHLKIGDILTMSKIAAKSAPLLCPKCKSIYSQLNVVNVANRFWRCYCCGVKVPNPSGIYPVESFAEVSTPSKGGIVNPMESIVCYEGKFGVTKEVENGNPKEEIKGGPKEEKKEKPNDKRIIFLIDVSGSMSVPSVAGAKPQITLLMEFITRELKNIQKISPDCKVGIIFFNRVLKIAGDGCGPTLEISSLDVLKDQVKLRQLVQGNAGVLLSKPISESLEKLLPKLNVEAENQTALGPALVSALELVKGSKTSKIYIFTDGMSNTGIGNLDKDCGVVDAELYNTLAKEAREVGAEVSIFKLSNAQHFLGNYYRLIKQSGGFIEEVNPDHIAESIKLGDKQVELASNTEITLRLPKYFKFRSVFEKGLMKTDNIFCKKYGRIVPQTAEILQFQLNPKNIEQSDVGTLMALSKTAFQLVITFTDSEAKDYSIVYTKEFHAIHIKEKQVDTDLLIPMLDNIIESGVAHDNLEGAANSLDVLLSGLINGEFGNERLDAIKQYAVGLQKQMRQEGPASQPLTKAQKQEQLIRLIEKKK